MWRSAGGCERVRTGVYGCRCVRWDTTTLKCKKNKRKQDENECAVHVCDACVAEKFLEKYMCESRHVCVCVHVCVCECVRTCVCVCMWV